MSLSHQQGDFLALFQGVVAKSVADAQGGEAVDNLDKLDAHQRRRLAHSAGPATSFAQGKIVRDTPPAGDDGGGPSASKAQGRGGGGKGKDKDNGKVKVKGKTKADDFENTGGPLAEAEVRMLMEKLFRDETVSEANPTYIRAVLSFALADARPQKRVYVARGWLYG